MNNKNFEPRKFGAIIMVFNINNANWTILCYRKTASFEARCHTRWIIYIHVSTMQYLFMSMFDRLKINYDNYNIHDNTESYYYYQDRARIQKPDAVQRKYSKLIYRISSKNSALLFIRYIPFIEWLKIVSNNSAKVVMRICYKW